MTEARGGDDTKHNVEYRRLLWPALVFILAAIVYGTAGFRGLLSRDYGMYLLAGQQVLEGVAPYKSIFLAKGPVAPMLAAAGVALSGPLRMDDLFTVRLLYSLVACVTAVTLYFLVQHLLESRRAGLLAALTFLGFYPVTVGATSGPEPKIVMLPPMILSLYFTSTRRWLWAGFFGSLVALTWQPMFVFPATTLLLSLLQAQGQRRRATLLTLAGGAAPVAAALVYFVERGALRDMVNDTILFNLFYLDRPPLSLLGHVLAPVGRVAATYGTMLAPIAIGLAMMIYLYVWQARGRRPLRAVLLDRFGPLLLTFIPPIAWSIKEFQGPPDFFVFLPFVTVGFALFLEKAVTFLDKRCVTRRLATILMPAVALSLIAATLFTNLQGRSSSLDDQLRSVQELTARFGPDVRVFPLSAPEVYALMHRPSPTPYTILNEVLFDNQEALIPGGFDGWFALVTHYDPDVVVYFAARGSHAKKVNTWLKKGYVLESIGMWRVYVKKSLL